MFVKVCKVCKEEFDTIRKVVWACRPCEREYRKNINAKRVKVRDNVCLRNKRDTLRKLVYDHYSENSCVHCGETRIPCLQLDHLRDKVLDVSKMVSRVYPYDIVVEEIGKCQVLCANCHAMKTSKDFNWYNRIKG